MGIVSAYGAAYGQDAALPGGNHRAEMWSRAICKKGWRNDWPCNHI